MKYVVSFCCLLALWLTACSSNKVVDPNAAFAGQSATQIYRQGDTALNKKQYTKAIEALEALMTLYPTDKRNEQAQLKLIYAYYQAKDNTSAEMMAERYARLFPQSTHAAYAYYLKGLANFTPDENIIVSRLNIDRSERDLSQQRRAFTAFSSVVKRYPNSPYAADARQRMLYLRDLFAHSETTVAKYYLRRQLYVSALNRAQEVLRHYPSTPSTEAALAVMISAYRELDLPEQAQQTQQVLALNYPHSVYLNKPNDVLSS